MDLSSSTDEIPTASETLLDDLRTQVRRAEAASDEYQQEIQVLKARLDELNAEHMKLEDVVATKDEKIQSLEGGKMQAEKQNKALESTALKEQTLFDRKRDASAAREEELIETIQRLKESLFRKEAKGTAQRTGELSPPGKQTRGCANSHNVVNPCLSIFPYKSLTSGRTSATKLASE